MIVCAKRSGEKIGIDRIGACSSRAPLAQITNPLTETRQVEFCGPYPAGIFEAQSIQMSWLIILCHCCEAYLGATIEKIPCYIVLV